MKKLNYRQQLLLLARFGFRRCGTSILGNRFVSTRLTDDEEFMLNDLGFFFSRDGVKVYVTIDCHD